MNINVKVEEIVDIVDKCSFKKLKLVDEIIKDYLVLGDFVDRDKKFLYRKG